MDEEKLFKFCVPWIFLSILYILFANLFKNFIDFGSISIHSSIAAVFIAFINNLEFVYIPIIFEKIKVKVGSTKLILVCEILTIFITFYIFKFFVSSLFNAANFAIVAILTSATPFVFGLGKKSTEYFFRKISWI